MICPVCGSDVAAKRNRCERCGEDLTIYRKIYLLSNKYYNEGLEKAKVRDLSGAILVLKKSLELNKRNTNARNLLGLIYYEVGETVSALSEWVISKHFQPKDNDADEYMESLQSNPTKLDTLNQTIKRYNSALSSAKQGSDDLAIIQLKKVTSLNPHFVKALQLLALLYMKNGETDKAVKCLIKANKIDVSNTTTLRYLHELGEMSATIRDDGKTAEKENVRKIQEPAVFPQSTYKEDKPNVWVFVNLILGIAIGILGVFFLIVPTVENSYKNKLKNQEVEFSAELNKNSQSVSSLENKNADLQQQVKDLQAQIDGFEVVEYDDTIYNDLFKAAKLFMDDLSDGSPGDVDYVKIANTLVKVKPDKLEKQEAKDLYNEIKDATYVEASKELYDKGHDDQYSNRKYDEALETLIRAYEFDPNNVDAVYFIGRSYHQLSDYDNAKKYYNIILDQFPDSGRAAEAQGKLADIE
ncbi:tetratricopeptide repeat protein [Anaerocolumna sedimenticola]|uniref:Tetratricopeptide repeat protein n=1 Tax=Anaerocolumna sedimenticola TaxID=2696063 RepID=A0A6P1THH0_9FIRM|nr:tetratricopeptide repeat protein [Anaerocolumna sedimenticola]QHQ59542.1 tetratricopeptide repeat protein [Anaerocolumna sedimenticola]